MKIALIGATGFVGSAVLTELLSRGHSVTALAREGVRRIDVLCPGFPADCLETLEELAIQNAEIFKAAGGMDYQYIAALNSRADHLILLNQLLQANLDALTQTFAH